MSNYIKKLLDVNKATAEKMRAEYWKKYGTSLAGLMHNYKIEPINLKTIKMDDIKITNDNKYNQDILKQITKGSFQLIKYNDKMKCV